MRCLKNDYISLWEDNRPSEIKELTSKGIIPAYHDIEERTKNNEELDPSLLATYRPLLMGQCAGAITEILPALDIVNEIVTDAAKALRQSTNLISPAAKL